jgi:serine/threonine protein kinase
MLPSPAKRACAEGRDDEREGNVPLRSAGASNAALARFEREAPVIAALSHPNIVISYDVGQSNGHPYAVMELLEGENLRARS